MDQLDRTAASAGLSAPNLKGEAMYSVPKGVLHGSSAANFASPEKSRVAYGPPENLQLLDGYSFDSHWRQIKAKNFDLPPGTVPAPGTLVEVHVPSQIGGSPFRDNILTEASNILNSNSSGANATNPADYGTSSHPLSAGGTEETSIADQTVKNDNLNSWRVGRVIEYNSFPSSFITADDATENEDSSDIIDAVFVQLKDLSPVFGIWVLLKDIRPYAILAKEHQKTLAEMYPQFHLETRRDQHSVKDDDKILPYQVSLRNSARTGIVWSGFGHCCPCYFRSTKNGVKLNDKYIHHERPERLIKIFGDWQRKDLLRYVTRVPSRMASLEQLQLVHSDDHLANYYYDDNDKTRLGSNEIRAAAAAAAARGAHRGSISSITGRAPDCSSITAGSLTHFPNNVDATIANGFKNHEIVNKSNSAVPVELGQSFADPERSLTSQEAFLERWNFIAHAQLSNAERDEQLPHFSSNFSCGFPGIAEDTTFNPRSSPGECRYSVGALFNLIDSLLTGRISNGFAAVRPPGHHAEADKAMGFCIYNNVALGTRWVLKNYPEKVKKVAIVDWDVHHGNGTESAFYDDHRVLYISLHKFENGQFYPFTGYPDRCGSGAGIGKNVNVAFSSLPDRRGRMGDTEYLSAFQHIVIPILQEFSPDLIFISAGFDLAEGHNEDIGGYRVTPSGIALMAKLLLEQVNRRVLAVLEGGYELGPLATGATACLQQLISQSSGDVHGYDIEASLASIRPNNAAQKSLIDVITIQSQHWRCMADLLQRIQTNGPVTLNLPENWCMGGMTRPVSKPKPGRSQSPEGISSPPPESSFQSSQASATATPIRRLSIGY